MIKVANLDMFRTSIIIGDNLEELKALNFTYHDRKPYEINLDNPLGCAFSAYYKDKFCTCIYLNGNHLDDDEVWVHEAFHAAQKILESLHINFVPTGSNEIYAYTIQYIYKCLKEFAKLITEPKIEAIYNCLHELDRSELR